jgi:hypothetical protein
VQPVHASGIFAAIFPRLGLSVVFIGLDSPPWRAQQGLDLLFGSLAGGDCGNGCGAERARRFYGLGRGWRRQALHAHQLTLLQDELPVVMRRTLRPLGNPRSPRGRHEAAHDRLTD